MLLAGKEVWNPYAAGWLEKQQMSLEVDILPANATGKSNA